METADEILGSAIVQQVVGADTGGFDTSFLIDAASELAKRGVDTYNAKQASDKANRDSAEQLRKAIAADAMWAAAERDYQMAAVSHDPGRVTAAKAMVDMAESDARSAGVGLGKDKVNQRVAAAATATKDAAAAAYSAPGDALKQAALRAWQKVTQAASQPVPFPGAGAGAGAGGGYHGGGGNFLTQVHAGVPTWGWLAGGATLLAGVVLLFTRKRR